MRANTTATWTDGTTYEAEVARALIDKLRARDRAQRAIIARLRDAEQTRAPSRFLPRW